MYDKLWLIPFFPLLGAIINGLLGKRFIKNEKVIGAIGTGMLFLSFLVSCKYFIQLLGDSSSLTRMSLHPGCRLANCRWTGAFYSIRSLP